MSALRGSAVPQIGGTQVLKRTRCDWIDRRERVIGLGPSGTGKTQVDLMPFATGPEPMAPRWLTRQIGLMLLP
ncbi:hypothetical protein [Rhodobaculum claviforme]|uniref:hypothetical protein n=1 Tax=Rhodobaculum claviforme TaxID=1549854 RepID=UPI001A92A08B|nr:hypothetical protein [Rhodobaculum claviforme]